MKKNELNEFEISFSKVNKRLWYFVIAAILFPMLVRLIEADQLVQMLLHTTDGSFLLRGNIIVLVILGIIVIKQLIILCSRDASPEDCCKGAIIWTCAVIGFGTISLFAIYYPAIIPYICITVVAIYGGLSSYYKY